MNVIYPQRIKQGSKVAIVAPASTFSTDELLAGLDVIKECGLRPVLGPCVKNLKPSFSHAANVQDRASEINWAFSNPNISSIFCVKGGEGSAALLPYLDYDVIRRSKKAFVGKSDITSLCNGIFEKSRLVTINGKTSSIHLDRGNSNFEGECDSLKNTIQLLMSDAAWGTRPFLKNQFIPRTVNQGKAEGAVIGGNCDTFTRLLGTEYFPHVENAILFIEDVHKSAESLSRQFLHLKLAGILDSVKGIVLGEFADVPDQKKKPSAVDDVIMEYFSNGPPCSYGYSFSHGKIIIPIPIGAWCTLDASQGIISFDFRMSTPGFGTSI